jgi:hypothetical protein
MLPSIGDESDYGSLAQKMLDDLFQPDSTAAADIFAGLEDPPSPSPGGDHPLHASDMLRSESGGVSLTSPLSASITMQMDEEDIDKRNERAS